MLIMWTGKRQTTEGIQLSNQETRNAWRKGNLLVISNIWSRHYQTSGDERKSFKDILGGQENYSKLNYTAEIKSKG